MQVNLEEIIKTIEKEGFFKKDNGQPWHPQLAIAKEFYQNYEIRSALKDKIENMLKASGFEELAQKYAAGERISISGFEFQQIKIKEEIDYKMFPIANSIAVAQLWLGALGTVFSIPAALLGFFFPLNLTFSSIIGGLAGKMLIKGIKAIKRKKLLTAIHQTSAGIGGLIKLPFLSYVTDVIRMGSLIGSFLRSIYDITLLYTICKIFAFRREIKDVLPDQEEIKLDVARQIGRYRELWKKYHNCLPKVENLQKELAFLNTVASHAKLYKLDLNKIDIEIDYVTKKFLSTAAARADLLTNTIDFLNLKEVDRPMFAKIYGHELAHLDGIINEGEANFKADALLEELASICPGVGYEFQLEKGKLISAGHAYAISSGKGIIDLIIEFRNLGMPKEAISDVLTWFLISDKLKHLFFLQHLIGGSHQLAGYTIDHYKLVKAAGGYR